MTGVNQEDQKKIHGEILTITYPVNLKETYEENLFRGMITHLEFKKQRDGIEHNLEEVIDSILTTFMTHKNTKCPDVIFNTYMYLSALDQHYKTNLVDEMPPMCTYGMGSFIPPSKILEKIPKYIDNYKKQRWECSADEYVNCPEGIKHMCHWSDEDKLIKRPSVEDISHAEIENFDDF